LKACDSIAYGEKNRLSNKATHKCYITRRFNETCGDKGKVRERNMDKNPFFTLFFLAAKYGRLVSVLIPKYMLKINEIAANAPNTATPMVCRIVKDSFIAYHSSIRSIFFSKFAGGSTQQSRLGH
jgi:hypothetical protein